MLTVKDATLTSTMIEGILYGFSVLMFIMTLKSLTYMRTVNRLMLVVTFLLFILSTLHIIADIIHVHRGFLVFSGSDIFFADAKEETFKNAVYELETLLADAILIYRCYIVWRSWWIIVLPCTLWVSVAVCGTATVWLISQPVANGANIFLIQVGRWVISFYSTAFVTNFISTGLLAYKIWSVNSGVYKTRASNTSSSQTYYKSGNLKPLLVFIIECGALYSCALLTMLATYLTKSSSAYIVIDLIGQIIPITFYGIIIRASMSATKDTSRSSCLPVFVPNFTGSHTSGNMVGTGLDVRVQIDQYSGTEMGDVSKDTSRSEYMDSSLLAKKCGEDPGSL
jgi:hypothetical protein